MAGQKRRGKHEDTTVSLVPLTFDEAIAKLAQTKHGDSQAAESDSTNSSSIYAVISSPPSTPMTFPVIHPVPASISATIAFATSSGVVARPLGFCSRTRS